MATRVIVKDTIETPSVGSDECGSVDAESTCCPFRVDLVREAYWELRYRRPGSDLTPQQRDARVGRRLAKLDGAVEIARDESADEDLSMVSLTPQRASHFGVDAIPVENIDALGVFHLWKIRQLTLDS